MNDNKLIAEFMGGEKPERTSDLRHFIDESSLLYHISWDWLMPVVESCYHNGADSNEIGDITHALLDCDIDATHKAVVEFIKTYNDER